MYMSYCRFEGTRHELNACMANVLEHINEEAEYSVSHGEIEHFKEMTKAFVDFLLDTEILEEAYINEEALKSVCEKMAQSFSEVDDYEC